MPMSVRWRAVRESLGSVVRLAALGCVLGGVLLLAGSILRAEIKGNVELLRLVALKHKANQERILTWRGEAEIVDDRPFEGDRTTVKHRVSFVHDRALAATRWNWTMLTTPPFVSNEMSVGNLFYQYGKVRAGDTDCRLLISAKGQARPEMFALSFDPLWYLTRYGQDITERLLFFHENADKLDLTVQQEGDRVIVHGNSPGVVSRYEFDLSKGGNLVAYVGQDSTVKDEWMYRYELRDGVWVPAEVTNKHDEYGPEGSLTAHTERIVRWTQSVLNQPVQPEEFSLQKLGLRAGDRVIDRPLNIEYKYGIVPGHENGLPEHLWQGTELGTPDQPLALEEIASELSARPTGSEPAPAQGESGSAAVTLAPGLVMTCLVAAGSIAAAVAVVLIRRHRGGAKP